MTGISGLVLHNVAVAMSPSPGQVRNHISCTTDRLGGFESWTSSALRRSFSSRADRLLGYLLAARRRSTFYLHVTRPCQHQQSFLMSSNYRKPQAFKSAGLIVSPQLTLSVYANHRFIQENETSAHILFTFTVRPLIFSLETEKANNSQHIFSGMTTVSKSYNASYISSCTIMYWRSTSVIEFISFVFISYCLTKEAAPPPRLTLCMYSI